jgi:hypothetical protein
MADFDEHGNWLTDENNTSNMSMNIKKHIRHGRHRAKKYNFVDDPVSYKKNFVVLCSL